MMPSLFKIGFLDLRIYSLMIILALILTIFMTKRRVKQLKFNPESMENMVIIIFAFAIIGARIYYVIFAWDSYKDNLLDIFAIWKGGLAIHGGIICGLIAAAIYSHYKKVNLLFMGDVIFPWVLLGQGFGRIGNFANGEAHGFPTITPPEVIFSVKPSFNEFWNKVLSTMQLYPEPSTISQIPSLLKDNPVTVEFQGKAYLLHDYVPWGVSFPSKYLSAAYREFGSLPVHPTFFYEMILNFIGWGIMYYFWRKDKWISTGLIMVIYLVFYGVIRGFVTFFRADDLMLGGFRAPHIISLILIATGSVLIANGIKKHKLMLKGNTASI